MTGDKVTMISSKAQDDEVLSRYKDIKPEFKRIYYNLHFIENNNKVCFVNGYRNEIVVYSIKSDISVKFKSPMPDGYSVTSSLAIYDEKLLLLGNSVGSVYFLSLTSQKFLRSGLHYSDVIRSMGGLLKLVKEPKDNPIFKPILRNAQVECDYTVVSIHSHPYIKFRVLVAFANNLAIIYDFEKERVDAVFDIFSAYNEILTENEKKLTADSNP